MNVAILGAGAIGFGSAALVEASGHSAALWSPSGRGTAALARGNALDYTGVMTGTAHPTVITDLGRIAGFDVVLVAIPANGHRATMERLAPHLVTGQTVIVSGALSLSPLYLSKLVALRGVRPTIACFGTTVLTARKTGECSVSINVLRARLDVAAIPAVDGMRALEICRQLFGDRFDLASSALAIALVNINPVAHAGLALANLTRIERGEAWPQYHYLTPAVARLIDGLDAERRAVGAAFGLSVRSRRAALRAFVRPPARVACRARGASARAPRRASRTDDARHALRSRGCAIWIGIHRDRRAHCRRRRSIDRRVPRDSFNPVGTAARSRQRPAACIGPRFPRSGRRSSSCAPKDFTPDSESAFERARREALALPRCCPDVELRSKVA
jgi:opine dehydrogenase